MKKFRTKKKKKKSATCREDLKLGQLPQVAITTVARDEQFLPPAPVGGGKSSNRQELLTRSHKPHRNTDAGATFSSRPHPGQVDARSLLC